MLTKDQVMNIVDRWFAGRNAIDKTSAFKMAMKVASTARDNTLRNVTNSLVDVSPSINEIQGKVTKH